MDGTTWLVFIIVSLFAVLLMFVAAQRFRQRDKA